MGMYSKLTVELNKTNNIRCLEQFTELFDSCWFRGHVGTGKSESRLQLHLERHPSIDLELA